MIDETSVADHKWLDPECGVNGCQSLIWQSRYESAVKGRQEFRQSYRRALADNAELVAALEEARWYVTEHHSPKALALRKEIDAALGI